MSKKNKNNKLTNYLSIIKSNFDVDKITLETKGIKQIRNYYSANHLAYLFFHTRSGFMHMGLSSGKKFKSDDLLNQLLIIQTLLHKIHAKNVLELGAGNGSNSLWLASHNPNISFVGLDLSKKPIKKEPNYEQRLGDFHDLSQYDDEQFDLIFVIEALCHSNQKSKVLNNVYMKLKYGGLFVIFDGYLKKPLSMWSKDEILAKKLTEKSMAVDSFDYLNDFEEIIIKSKFSIMKRRDYSHHILPSLKRFENLGFVFLKFHIVTKFFKFTLPSDFVHNSIAGLLMPTLVRTNLACYYLHILEKSHDE